MYIFKTGENELDEITQKLKNRHPNKLLVWVTDNEKVDFDTIYSSGVHSVLPYIIDPNEFMNRLDECIKYEFYVHYKFHRHLIERYLELLNKPKKQTAIKREIFIDEYKALAYFTRKEIEIYSRIAEAKNNFEISEEMFLSINTVRNHVRKIFIKLGVRDRVQAIKKGIDTGIVKIK